MWVGHALSECRQFCGRHLRRFRFRKAVAQRNVIRQEFLQQRNQLRQLPRCRKQNLLFRREMNPDFALKMLRDFRLPRRQIGITDR